MNIICNDINSFCTMITTCMHNGTKDIRVFISEKDSYRQGPLTPNNLKDHKSFTYAFFSPLYTAIYSGNVKIESYDFIYSTLEKCQEQCKHDFRIQIFDELYFNSSSNHLKIGNELNVI